MKNITIALMLLAACGSPQATSKAGMNKMAADAPPPPTAVKPNAKIDRKVSREARADYNEALALYNDQAKEGWQQDECAAVSHRFQGVADAHDKMVEARFMSGLALHNCGILKEAEAEYQQALKINSSYAPALSNLGVIYYRGGNEKRGEEYWSKAIQADPKTSAARNNMAWIYLQRIRATRDASTAEKYEDQAKGELSRVLAVDNDNMEAYVIYALIYMEGSERNKSRLDLANLLLDEAEKRQQNYAPLYNARGLLLLRRDNVGQALTMFERAVALDPNFVEARMNVGNIVLGFRKYEQAQEQFSAVLKLQPKNYDALIGLGIAQRGRRELDQAESSYQAAKDLEPQRGAAYFNLGVLYKDFRANQSPNEKATRDAYKAARNFFQDFVSKKDVGEEDRTEAKNHIEDCGKYIEQLDQVINAPPPAPEPAPAAPAAPANG